VLLLLARQFATAAQLAALRQPVFEAADVNRFAAVVAETGAVAAVEKMVERRVDAALEALEDAPIDAAARSALAVLAITATDRRA
jgi:geranylgeranyl diphosphate synthase type I